MAKYFYAVQKGRNPGVYETWPQCQKEVAGYPGAVFKKFSTPEEAQAFVHSRSSLDHAGSSQSVPIPDTDAIAYVDGSFQAAKKIYGYGVLLLMKDGTKYEFQGSGQDPELVSMRNVAGEILGAMRAVQEAHRLGLKSLTIYYDYMGIECWASGAWKCSKEGTRDYRRYMQDMGQQLSISFQKVKAHSGVLYNEVVDRLAKEAVGNL